MHDDLPRHGIRQAEIIRHRHAVDEHTGLIAPSHGLDHVAIILHRHSACQAVMAWLVVKPPIEPRNV